MDYKKVFTEIKENSNIIPLNIIDNGLDEAYIDVKIKDFNKFCLELHTKLKSPVMMFFVNDECWHNEAYLLQCAFQSIEFKKWFFLRTYIPNDNMSFNSLSKEIFSAALFEREIKEMFGIEPIDSPDARRLNLHDEVWPENLFPLRKDFEPKDLKPGAEKDLNKEYIFNKVEGDGVFEVPVGPVHAGIIGSGHFRFSAAGEPILNLEIRLGFTHRGVEKTFENKTIEEGLSLSECVCGDSVFAHSLAYCMAVEKIKNYKISDRTAYIRAIFLELERMYNHVSDIGGIALDVSFSFPAALASLIKESFLSINEKLTGSRYLKGINTPGNIKKDIDFETGEIISKFIDNTMKSFKEFKNILLSNVSFMDRVDGTGILDKKTAEDIGVIGLAGKASGINRDLRRDFSGDIYNKNGFNVHTEINGDVLSRLKIRINEFEESAKLIKNFIKCLNNKEKVFEMEHKNTLNFALGYIEAWRGPVLYWVKLDENGSIERCKIVDSSFHNWRGLSYCAPGNIIPDFPLCNKSFNLSYSGNDL